MTESRKGEEKKIKRSEFPKFAVMQQYSSPSECTYSCLLWCSPQSLLLYIYVYVFSPGTLFAM